MLKDIAVDILKIAKSKGCTFCDMRFINNKGKRISIENGHAKKLSGLNDTGACVRVLYKSTWGFSSTNFTSKEKLVGCFNNALSSAKFKSKAEQTIKLPEESFLGNYKNPVKIEHENVNTKDYLKILSTIESSARLYDKKIKNTVLNYFDMTTDEQVFNTFGTETFQTTTRSLVGLYVVASDGKKNQNAYDSIGKLGGFEVLQGVDAENFGKGVAKRAVDLLSADSPPAGEFTIVTNPGVTGLFAHEAVGHNSEADLVVSKMSILEGKLNNKIASDCVTLIDDSTIESAWGSYKFDSEGTPSQKRLIIKDGVLVGLMHNLETASRMFHRPNGSGRGYLHQYIPIVRMSNTYFQPGKSSLDEMISDIKYGLLVKGRYWGYVMVEKGQFTCNVEEGVVIRNGKLCESVANFSIGGLTLDTLKNISDVSKDFELALPGTCGKGQPMWVDAGGPYLKISKMNVGGYKK